MNQNSKSATLLEQVTKANPSDVTSLDSIVRALYNGISGDVRVKHGWNRLRSLFVPGAKVISLWKKRKGDFDIRSLTVEAYIKRSGVYIEINKFFEREISRKIERFGNLAHVFLLMKAEANKLVICFLRGASTALN